MIDVLLPFVTHMCNALLREGCLPISQGALITSNYRWVSNLTIMSKVVERMVADQMLDYLQSSAQMPELQSAYRQHHSTETALLFVVSDYLLAADTGSGTLLGLLELRAAFDTVDTGILDIRLQNTFGTRGTVLRGLLRFYRAEQ